MIKTREKSQKSQEETNYKFWDSENHFSKLYSIQTTKHRILKWNNCRIIN